ncbi:hypothetical protein F5B17DRAFT_294078 [Nemania serpens]|nr:hypothetical protein F5B17DRAFT_294078 [Nemania serpens]
MYWGVSLVLAITCRYVALHILEICLALKSLADEQEMLRMFWIISLTFPTMLRIGSCFTPMSSLRFDSLIASSY